MSAAGPVIRRALMDAERLRIDYTTLANIQTCRNLRPQPLGRSYCNAAVTHKRTKRTSGMIRPARTPSSGTSPQVDRPCDGTH